MYMGGFFTILLFSKKVSKIFLKIFLINADILMIVFIFL